MAKATSIVRHRVEDYGAWRSVYDDVQGLRDQYGVTDAEVLVDPQDKQDITVIHRFPDLASAEGFVSSPELKAAMQRAGVAGSPRIELTVEA
jgi:quinol monooxygenase YgiN